MAVVVIGNLDVVHANPIVSLVLGVQMVLGLSGTSGTCPYRTVFSAK